jgi:hypothetical protein
MLKMMSVSGRDSPRSNGISRPQNPQPTRNPECRGLAMNDGRHGTVQRGLIFGIKLREFFSLMSLMS